MGQSIHLLLGAVTEEDCLAFESLLAGKSYSSGCSEDDEVSYIVYGLSREAVELWSKQHQIKVEVLD